MSNSPSDLLSLRSRFAEEAGLAVTDIGIAADESHLTGGGYHCGGLDLRRINAIGRDDYSIRQPRDRAYYQWELAHGSNWASAMDLGEAWKRGGRGAWIRFNNLFRAQLGAKDPALAAVRGVNYTPDGTTKRRFDCLTHQESSSADTVTWHTHIEWWRDTIATAVRAYSINRLVQIAIAARDNVALPTSSPTKAPAAVSPLALEGASMIYTLNNVPAGALDALGNHATNGGQYILTAGGPVNLTGDEFFSQPDAVEPNRITTTWARAVAICGAMRSQANLTSEQYSDFKAQAVPIVHDAAQTGAADGARSVLDGATIHAPVTPAT